MDNPSLHQQITFLYVNDLQKSADFYENKMGFRLWLDQGACRIYHLYGASYLGICQRRESRAPSSPDTVIFTLVTDEVMLWYETLSARGVSFEKEPQINERYQIYHCFLRDPDGYLIEIQRFLDRPALL